MGPFAHLGLTTGVAVLANSIWNYRREAKAWVTAGTAEARKTGFWKPLSFTSTLAVLFGSLVSDAIDKPIGGLFFADYFSNGRIFAHTLLFLLVVSAAGLLVWKHTRKDWLLFIAFGISMHLLLDEMWLEPRTLFWPLLGWEFPHYPRKAFVNWLVGVFEGIITNPLILLSELAGLFLIVWLEAPGFITAARGWLLRRKK